MRDTIVRTHACVSICISICDLHYFRAHAMRRITCAHIIAHWLLLWLQTTEEWVSGIVNNMARKPNGGDTDQIYAVATREKRVRNMCTYAHNMGLGPSIWMINHFKSVISHISRCDIVSYISFNLKYKSHELNRWIYFNAVLEAKKIYL